MKKLYTFISNLSKKGAEESSKRFIALYVTIVLITFVVFRYTDKSNVLLILVELIGLVVSLVTVASWEKRNHEKYHKDDLHGRTTDNESDNS